MTIVVGAPIEGCDGYCFARSLPGGAAIRRRWTWHGATRSVEWRAGGVVKLRERFGDHATVAEMESLLAEADARGVVRPSSYGDLFHQRNFTPAIRADHRKMFPAVPGGWNAVTTANPTYRGKLYRYDIRSAYLWALSLGFPHPATFETVRRVSGPGVYWCPSPCNSLLPHPWNKTGIYPATEDELLALPLPVREITRGVRFTPGTFDTGAYVADIQAWSCWKQVARAFWGRWIAAGRLRQEWLDGDGDLKTANDLADNRRIPVWGAIITSRLRMRLWEMVDRGDRRVLRVVTDSIVTDTPVDESPEIGGWKLEEEYSARNWRVELAGLRAA